MGKVVILGCGYVGRLLARRLVARGDPVRATTTTEAKLDQLGALGVEPALVRADQPESFRDAMADAEVVVHLAPPGVESATSLARRVRDATGPALRVYLYGSSTAAFGRSAARAEGPRSAPADPEAWVDETTPPGELNPRGLARLEHERALADVDLPLRVLRIAGIYGPGRTLRDQIERDALVLFHGPPPTSRIHVEDLVRLLEAMIAPGADVPPLVVACDEAPATTLEVARYTCMLLGRTPPEPVALEDARRVMSPLALEMRLGGHRCRSLHRERLIGALSYPTYREGVRQSLEAEGALRTAPAPCYGSARR